MKRFAVVLLVVCLASTALGCVGKPKVPEGFPEDFPLPAGRVIGQGPGTQPNTVYVTVEAVLGVGDCVRWFQSELPAKGWQPYGGQEFVITQDYSTGNYTNGTRTVSIMVTDLGNTTKATITVAVP